MHITDRRSFRAVESGVALLQAFYEAGPEAFAWREPPYEYEYVIPPIDILYGSARLREAIEQRVPASDIAAEWPAASADFGAVRERFLLYPS